MFILAGSLWELNYPIYAFHIDIYIYTDRCLEYVCGALSSGWKIVKIVGFQDTIVLVL